MSTYGNICNNTLSPCVLHRHCCCAVWAFLLVICAVYARFHWKILTTLQRLVAPAASSALALPTAKRQCYGVGAFDAVHENWQRATLTLPPPIFCPERTRIYPKLNSSNNYTIFFYSRTFLHDFKMISLVPMI